MAILVFNPDKHGNQQILNTAAVNIFNRLSTEGQTIVIVFTRDGVPAMRLTDPKDVEIFDDWLKGERHNPEV